jgi:hypothetical protein
MIIVITVLYFLWHVDFVVVIVITVIMHKLQITNLIMTHRT